MRVLKTPEAIIKHLRSHICKSSLENNYSFYSSLLKGITTDPVFMTVPLDDKMVHRAFGIYETFTIHDSCVYNLHRKVQSLYSFAEAFKLRPPFDSQYAQAVVIALARAAKRPNCQVTMWMSPGPGDYSLYIKPDSFAAVYALCHKEIDTLPSAAYCETKKLEYSSPVKTTNYVFNCINASAAKAAGGYLGIMVDKEDNVLEAAIANVGMVLKTGELLIPPFDHTLAGTTALRLLEYANEVLLPKGIITGIKRENIKVQQAKKEAKEVMLLGGNTCVPVLQWDSQKISDQPGPITLNVQKFFNEVDCKLREAKGAHVSIQKELYEFKEEETCCMKSK